MSKEIVTNFNFLFCDFRTNLICYVATPIYTSDIIGCFKILGKSSRLELPDTKLSTLRHLLSYLYFDQFTTDQDGLLDLVRIIYHEFLNVDQSQDHFVLFSVLQFKLFRSCTSLQLFPSNFSLVCQKASPVNWAWLAVTQTLIKIVKSLDRKLKVQVFGKFWAGCSWGCNQI
jgi:hypothetical protein